MMNDDATISAKYELGQMSKERRRKENEGRERKRERYSGDSFSNSQQHIQNKTVANHVQVYQMQWG